MLETELDQKNKQISEFQERQREFNLLVKTQFEHSALDKPAAQSQPNVHDTVIMNPKEGAATADKPSASRDAGLIQKILHTKLW